ncbi:ATP-dependent DNA helicase RecG [bacterium]|nr:ATP-dependent DNA helicase RecG [bacterium]
MDLNTKLNQIYGIGASIYKKLQKLELNTVKDILFYYPFRYDDYSQIKKIKNLQNDETTTVQGRIILINNKRAKTRRMNITEALLEDETGQVNIVWFNQAFITKNIQVGDKMFISGKIKKTLLGYSFVSPNYEKINSYEGKNLRTTNTARIIPIYPSTERLTQKQIRYLIKASLPTTYLLEEWLPKKILKNEKLLILNEALRQIHFPDNQKKLKEAKERIAFNEIFTLISLAKSIKRDNQKNKALQIEFHEKQIKKFVQSLPFKLTNDQRKTTWQILQDLEKKIPMNRLLEGDVGSGKTIVALISAYNTILNKYQVALMVPTQILAQQHFENIIQYLVKKNITIALFTNKDRQIYNGSKKIAETLDKKKIIEKINAGKIDFIIGTHSIINKDIKFKNLGLIIVDEQHRFGVNQRHNLLEKSKAKKSPHFLSMTATPIPRSLALSIYGDLDISQIKEKPLGRKEIITRIVEPQNRTKAYEFIYNHIQKGHQIFVVCPLINESDKLGVKSVTQEYEKLNNEVFPNLEIGLLHGKLKENEKKRVLDDFANNKIKILVSTSVIEVGVDYPNATIMMIEGADRFGLASLHQFRGRVGRGEHQSFCFLFTENSNPKTKQRLDILTKTTDGFKLAEADLKSRGSGDIYGTTQSGFLSQIKIADLSDLKLNQKVRNWVEKIFNQDPELKKYPLLKDKIDQISKDVHLE